jgi:hypothetical protein
MNPGAPYNAAMLGRFASACLRPRLAKDFLPFHKMRDLGRFQGNFFQLLTLRGGRYGDHLGVRPIFYVVGARPWNDRIPRSAPLGKRTQAAVKWRFRDRRLDDVLAQEICGLLEAGTPLSFARPIGPEEAHAALQSFASADTAEHVALHLAFFCMALGLPGAGHWLSLARNDLLRNGRAPTNDWQIRTLARLDELESRLARPDGVRACRREAEQHAARLRLPSLRWPRTA